MKKFAFFVATLALFINSIGAPTSVLADSVSTASSSFESPYTTGNINGQQGWIKTGPYNSEVSSVSTFPNASGFGFETQALRIDNAITSGSFGDQTFSPGVDPSGESVTNTHFETSFSIGSTKSEQQPGLFLSVSPDDGNGSRMSYVGFQDQSDGIHVIFYDVTDTGPVGTTASWNDSDVATLSRTSAHSIKFVIDFKPGPANDIVELYVDGSLVKTGTTWEDYYRYDSEQAGNGNQIFPISKVLFRAGGTAAPGTAGNGFLIDNVLLTSGPTPSVSITAPVISGFTNPTLNCGAVTNIHSTTVNWSASTGGVGGILGYEYAVNYPLVGGGYGNWSTFLTRLYNTGSLNEGVHTIKVRAKDTAGNYSEWSDNCTITADWTAPAVPTLLSPSNGAHVRPVGLILDWSNVSDPSSPVKYYYQSALNSSVGADNALTTPIYNSGALSTSQINASGSADNTYYWQVKACDSVGNCSAWSNTWQVNIDNTPPAAPVISLPLAEQAFNTTPILDKWSAVSDASGIDFYRIEYIYDDGHTFSGGPYRTTTATQRNHTPTIGEQGGVTIRVQAVDKAGNAGAWSAPVHYFYDATAPTGTWVNPLENDTLSGTTTLSFNASDSISGVNSISYQYRKNGGVDTFHDIAGSSWDTSDLSLGFYTLRAIVTDNAGNTANFDETVGVAAVILNMNSNTTTYGATITWITDRPTKSRVVFDTVSHTSPDLNDPNYGYAYSTPTYDTNPEVTNHTVNITGLNDGTVYYFRVISEGSPIAVGGESGFKTNTTTGAPAPNGNGGGVLGTSTTSLPAIAWVNSYSSKSTSEEVLGAETSVTPTPTPTVKPSTTGFEPETTASFNLFAWVIGHKTVSLGLLALIILIAYFILRKKKS